MSSKWHTSAVDGGGWRFIELLKKSFSTFHSGNVFVRNIRILFPHLCQPFGESLAFCNARFIHLPYHIAQAEDGLSYLPRLTSSFAPSSASLSMTASSRSIECTTGKYYFGKIVSDQQFCYLARLIKSSDLNTKTNRRLHAPSKTDSQECRQGYKPV